MDENSSSKPSAEAEDETKADMSVDEAGADTSTDNLAEEDQPEAKPASRARRRRRPSVSFKDVRNASNAIRSRVASVVWIIAVVCAVILALGALLIALDANENNSLVSWFQDAADTLAGPFGRIFEFELDNGRPDATKNALVNWGIAAAAYLVIGRILERIIRP